VRDGGDSGRDRADRQRGPRLHAHARHVLVASPALRQQYPERFDRDSDLARAVASLREARVAGVRTIVDLTPISLGRDAAFIREASIASGVQVIVATGLYWYPELALMGLRTDAIADWFVRDIAEGIGNTGVRAGVIKCATEPALDRANAKVLRASARAHRRTGVPICTHTFAPNRVGLDQLQVFRDEGVDLGRVVIGHSDDSDDIDYLDQLIQAGAYCGMDRIGVPFCRTSEQRADMVAALVARGYADRITLSHDAGVMDGFATEEIAERSPDWRYTFIPREFRSLLRERGVRDDDFEQMTVRNPRRIFEQRDPY
jgi:phosphotriesterase-related protein